MQGPIVILGAGSLLGSHVARIMSSRHPSIEQRAWDPVTSTVTDAVPIVDDELVASLVGAQLIINCHEASDLSLCPDEQTLAAHNEDFVTTIRKINDCPFIHISTVLVQCSNFWPNTYEPERNAQNYTSQWPFKAYCQSKDFAEKAALAVNDDVVILRIPFLYGDGDSASIVTDAIRSARIFSSIPNIGDRGGVFQMAYAGNVASGIEKVAAKMLNSQGFFRPRELMILCDDTPIGDPYSTIIQPFNPKQQLAGFNIPFLPVYYLYTLLAWLLLIMNRVVNISPLLAQLPDPSMLYLVFHHWTLFNTNKSSHLLDDQYCYPREYVEVMSRSHYNRLSTEKMRSSWCLKTN